MHKNHILASWRMECIGSLSRFDIYYKQIYLKAAMPPTKKPEFYKIQKIPQKVGKKMAKSVKTRTPRFGT